MQEMCFVEILTFLFPTAKELAGPLRVRGPGQLPNLIDGGTSHAPRPFSNSPTSTVFRQSTLYYRL